MEPVSLFHDDQDHGHLGSGLKLRSFISEGLHHPPEENQHGAAVTGSADAHPKDELMKSDEDSDVLLLTEEPKGGRKDEKNPSNPGTSGATPALHSAEEDPVGYDDVREELDDATDMCFEGCVISGSPISNPTKQENPLEYDDTYLESLNEKDGMLINSVPASSPASFFQSETIHVSKNNSPLGHGDSWRDIDCSHERAEHHTSSSEIGLTGKQAADSIFPKDVTDGTLANDGISGRHVDWKSPRFNELSAHGLTYAEENCQSSKRSMETTIRPEQNNITRGYVVKDKMEQVDLCLRSVLSDPITGAFLDDAMVAQCGHSFGSDSLQKVMETHVCTTCGAAASPNLLVPNFALRAAVLAYKNEDQVQVNLFRGLKRRREGSEQVEGFEAKRTERDHGGSFENISTENSRSKSIQFPFAVSDKVFIKGNKRTPERFVGREAVITTQCLNGWYLVKTLDTGESVRLQYRSLQKLGDVEMPCTVEMEYSPEQGGDDYGSPVEISRCPTKAAVNRGLESRPPASKRDTTNGKLAQHGFEEKTDRACSSGRDLIRPLYSSKVLKDGCGINSIRGVTRKIILEDLLNDQVRNSENHLMEEGPEISTDQHPNIGSCAAAVGREVSDAMVEKFRTDLLHGISTFHDESGDEQTAQDGPQSATSSKFCVGAKSDFLDTHTSKGEEVLEVSKVVFTDPVGDDTGVGGPTGNKVRENENDLLRTRSRRTSQNSRISSPNGVIGQDSDPYRKVYRSGYRRRGGRGDKAVKVNPDDTVAEHKVSVMGQRSGRNYSEALHGGRLGSGKHGRDTKVKSTGEILQIMRKDMLKLEKQIPRCYLLNTWRSDRVCWRKAVKASSTVLELGELVREFRSALLLTAAGGMTDEELEKRLTTIGESQDVDLLVSLWGRLYDDVYKCVEARSKSFSSLANSLWRRLLTVEAKDINELDFSSSGQSVSPDEITTEATIIAAVGGCEQNSSSDVKTLLSSTMSLLQKRSTMELMSVKEALEREKRHIVAKLAKLEESYAKLGSTPRGNSLTGARPLEEGSNGQRSRRISLPSNNNFCSGNLPVLCAPDEETDGGESDRTSPAQDADGEATDLSDSD